MSNWSRWSYKCIADAPIGVAVRALHDVAFGDVMSRVRWPFLCFLTAAIVSGCGARGGADNAYEAEVPAYKTSRSIPPLEVPADLSQGAAQERLRIPASGTSAIGTPVQEPSTASVAQSARSSALGAAAPARPTTPSTAPQRPPRATLSSDADGAMVVLTEDFTRAWRRTGVALNRLDFTVVDRDRSTGVFYVRYSDPDAPKPEKGFLSSLKFWGDEDVATAKEYQVALLARGDGAAASTQIVVRDAAGLRDASATAGRMLSLLAEELR